MSLYNLNQFQGAITFGFDQFLLVSNHMSRELDNLDEPAIVDLSSRFRGNLDQDSFHVMIKDTVDRLGGKIVLVNGEDVVIGGNKAILHAIQNDIGTRFTYDLFDREHLNLYVDMMKGLHEKYGHADAETFFGRRFGDAPHLDS